MRCDHCGEPVQPVVAVDIDGTLADYHHWFFRFARQWLGVSHEKAERWLDYDGSMRIADWMRIEDRTYREIKLAYRQGGMKRSMPLIPGARELMEMLRRNDVQIWITTTRPYLRLDNIDPDTREWLRRNEIPFDRLMYEDDKYGHLIKQVDKDRIVCVVDDLKSQCEDAELYRLQVLQVGTTWNSGDRHAQCVEGLDLVMEHVTVALHKWRNDYGPT